jgi:hypothetical protein
MLQEIGLRALQGARDLREAPDEIGDLPFAIRGDPRAQISIAVDRRHDRGEDAPLRFLAFFLKSAGCSLQYPEIGPG